MQKASDQAERAGKIIRRMRDMVKKSDPNREPIALGDLLDEARAFADIESTLKHLAKRVKKAERSAGRRRGGVAAQ